MNLPFYLKRGVAGVVMLGLTALGSSLWAAPVRIESVSGRANKTAGAALQAGERVHSGKDTMVIMSIDQGKAAAASDTRITARSGNQVELEEGTSLLSTRRGGTATMTTTESAIDVKGTMQVAYMPGAYIKVTCLSGKVRLKLRAGSRDAVTLRPGQMVFFQLPAVKLPEPIDVDLKQMIATSSLLQATLPSMPGAGEVNQSTVRQQRDIAAGRLTSTAVAMAGGAPIADFNEPATDALSGAPRDELGGFIVDSDVEVRQRQLRRRSFRLRARSLLLDHATISVPPIPDDVNTPETEGEINLQLRNWQIIRNNSLVEAREVINYVGTDFEADLMQNPDAVQNDRLARDLSATLPVDIVNSTVTATDILDIWVSDAQNRQRISISNSTVGSLITDPQAGRRVNGIVFDRDGNGTNDFDSDWRFTSARAHHDLPAGAQRSTDTIWIWNENLIQTGPGILIENSLIGGLDTSHVDIFTPNSLLRIHNSLIEADRGFDASQPDIDTDPFNDLSGLLWLNGQRGHISDSRLFAADEVLVEFADEVLITGSTLDATLNPLSTSQNGSVAVLGDIITIGNSRLLAERNIEVGSIDQIEDIVISNSRLESRGQNDFEGLITVLGGRGQLLGSDFFTFDEVVADFSQDVEIADAIFDATAIGGGADSTTGHVTVRSPVVQITDSVLWGKRNVEVSGRDITMVNSDIRSQNGAVQDGAGGFIESDDVGEIRVETPGGDANSRVIISSSVLREFVYNDGQSGPLPALINVSSAGSLELINNTMAADVIKATSFGPGGLTITGGRYDAPTMLQFYAENGHNLTFRGAVDVRSNDARFAGRTVQVDHGGAVNATGNVRVFRDVDNYNKAGFGNINATGTRADLPYDSRPR